MSKVKVMLAGIGGYGELYLTRLFRLADEGKVDVVGLVDPFPSDKHAGEIKSRGWKLFNTTAEFYAENSADLACISTPIGFHTPMILEALSHGCDVICEKPLTGDIEDVDKLIKARDEAGKFVMIGYQWSHSKAILDMKRDVIAGVYGEPEFLKTLVLWPRNKAYFKRGTGWAGKIRDKSGTLILDSVANNAAAHYLHNIFFTLGKELDRADCDFTTEAELWRANPIENFDTAVIRCAFRSGAKSLYIASHATGITRNPIFEYKFSDGELIFEEETGGNIIGKTKSGETKVYGNPFADNLEKLDIAVDNILTGKVFVPCGIEAASAQVRCIADCAKLPIQNFPADRIKVAENELTYVEGLHDELCALYENA